jgi:hypothetical protein
MHTNLISKDESLKLINIIITNNLDTFIKSMEFTQNLQEHNSKLPKLYKKKTVTIYIPIPKPNYSVYKISAEK